MPFTLPPLDRRHFLKASLAGFVAGLAPAADASDGHTWALLSDTHIDGNPKAISRDNCMGDRLTTAVAEVLALPKRPVAALVNGDLALKAGYPSEYKTFVKLIEPLRKAGIPLHLTMGNHDDRTNFLAGVPDVRRPDTPVANKYVGVVNAGRARFVLLDSLQVIDRPPGECGKAQLDWLAKTLDAEPTTPTVIFGHHNPAGLTDSEAFFGIIAPRRQVKAYIFGHTHSWQVAKHESGIHLVNLPAVAYPFSKGQVIGWATMALKVDGATIQLRAADKHQLDRQTHELAWRS